MASKLGTRVDALEVRAPHNEFSHLSDEELDNQIAASLKTCDERDRDWVAKLISDPSESSQELVWLMAMSGLLNTSVAICCKTTKLVGVSYR